MNKLQNRIIIVLCILIGVVLVINAILLGHKNGDKPIEIDTSPDIKEYVYYECQIDSIEREDFILETKYMFSFVKNNISKSEMEYYYTFKNQESYDNFSTDTFKNPSTPIEEFDSENLTKKFTYFMRFIFNEGENNAEEYKNIVEKNGFKCNLIESN